MSSLNPFAKKKDKDEAQTSSEPTKAPETKKEEKKEPADIFNEGQAESNPTVASSEEGKESICQMKRGDYMIHVYIEQAKNLKVPPEETVDPIVQI